MEHVAVFGKPEVRFPGYPHIGVSRYASFDHQGRSDLRVRDAGFYGEATYSS